MTAYRASPDFVFAAEMSLACTYALRRPRLAKECAETALMAALQSDRADLVRKATALLTALNVL
jgi:hypothetical protein